MSAPRACAAAAVIVAIVGLPAMGAHAVGKVKPLPVVRVTWEDWLVQSRGGVLTQSLPITLDAPAKTAVSVDYVTVVEPGDVGTPGVQFVPISGTVTFAPGQVQEDVKVRVPRGTATTASYDPAFHLVISNPVGAVIGLALGAIYVQPTMDGQRLQSGSTFGIAAGSKGRPRVARLTFALTERTDHAVTGTYSTGNESGLAGVDYVSKTGTITIPAGKLSATVTIKVLPHAGPVSARAFVVGVLNIQGVPGEEIAGAFIELAASS